MRSAQAAGRVSTSRVGPRPRPTGSQRQPCSLLARNAAQEGSVAGPRLPCARVDRAHAVMSGCLDGGWCCAARMMAEMPLANCRCACVGSGHVRLRAAEQGTALITPCLLWSLESSGQNRVLCCAGLGWAAHQAPIALARAEG
jgi:hypothetical protein